MKRAWIVWIAFVLCWGIMVGATGLFHNETSTAHVGLGRDGVASAPSAPLYREPSNSGDLPSSETAQTQTPAPKVTPTNAPQLPVSSGGTSKVRGSDPSSRLSHLTVVDEHTAWVIRTNQADVDTIAATQDGGATWSDRAGMGDLHVLALHAVSASVAWAAASSECSMQQGVKQCSQLQVLGTQDGGKSWSQQLKLASDAQEASIEAKDARHAVVLAGGKLYRSEDGGRHWNELKLGIVDFVPQQISFPTAEHGWVSGSICSGKQADGSVSCQITVVRTSDGGAQWQQLPQSGEPLSGANSSLIRFVDAKHGWLLCSDVDMMRATLYATTDGGQHWAAQRELSSARPAPAGLEFATAEDGWIPLTMGAGPIEGGMLVTHDGGLHYDKIGAERGWSFDQASALSAKEIWAIEHGNAIVKSTDGGNTWRQLYPLPAPVNDFVFVDAQHGFGLGTLFERKTLLATSNGGRTWSKLPAMETQEAITAISFINEQTGWALQQASDADTFQLLQTKDGGRKWKALANIATANSSSRPFFRFFSERDGVLVTIDGKTQTVYRTKDGGRTWTAAPSPYVQAGGGNLFDFSSPNVGWTYMDESPEQGAVLYRTEDGRTWQPFGVLPKSGWAYALGWATDQIGWALYQHDPFKAGSSWSLLATADSGAAWRETMFPPDFRFDERSVKLQFVDDKHGWLLGGSGMLKTEDGGESWTWLG